MVREVFIPKAWHRFVVGSRGSNIKYVQSQFSVKCRVPPPETSSTLIMIDGEGEDDAVAFIESKLGFPLAAEPLVTVKIEMSMDEAKSLFAGKSLWEVMKEFGVGIRPPRKEGDVVLVQGPQEKVDELMGQWGEALGREVEPQEEEEYDHKVEIHQEKLAEALFFEDEGEDDDHDLNRFIEVLQSGDHSLDICVFTITNNRIADAIIREHRRGVRVRVITDNHTSGALGSDVEKIADRGIPVKIDVSEGHMHHKFAVIDGKLLINGSFNWTRGAGMCNYENVTIQNDEHLAKLFSEEFEKLWNDNERFESV